MANGTGLPTLRDVVHGAAIHFEQFRPRFVVQVGVLSVVRNRRQPEIRVQFRQLSKRILVCKSLDGRGTTKLDEQSLMRFQVDDDWNSSRKEYRLFTPCDDIRGGRNSPSVEQKRGYGE